MKLPFLVLALFAPTLLLLTYSCTSVSANNNEAGQRTVRLPGQLKEASGLSIENRTFYWHNDSGDGPYLYATDGSGRLLSIDTLDAEASDWEDMTRDDKGNFYLGDIGNNLGRKTEMAIYRYNRASQVTEKIAFRYPGQNGEGRDQAGNHNCEALVYENGYLHLFTKDLIGRGSNYMSYHFRVPAVPGTYEAELLDSLRIPGRVVTAAALDTVNRQLVMTAYNFKRTLGFFPNGAASVITISNYPPGRYLAGDVHRDNLSWGVPTQFEAIDFWDAKTLYVASEGTLIRPGAVGKLKRRYRPK